MKKHFTSNIIFQNLKMQLEDGANSFREDLLIGEIEDTEIEHLAFVGPTLQKISLLEEHMNMFLFLKGNAELVADNLSFQIVPESIAIPLSFKNIQINVEEGETLHYVALTKKYTQDDHEDFNTYPNENKPDLFFTKFSDCDPYTEKIKSPKTISRTVLPEDIIPRVALGTVEALGPDEVRAHKHPMLDQLFLGLTDNCIRVYADGRSIELGPYSLLHIPIGSSHWVTVEKGDKLFYLWMDFFLDRTGQQWLKTHKPITTKKND
tara:strand:- start:1153 stop:1944 length:792 start_codon:yes stop_codon:yes gene_type:complete